MLVTTRYTLTNAYFYVSGINGVIDALSFDPAGTSSYGGNLIKSGQSFYVSLYKEGVESIGSGTTGTWAISGSTLTISDVPFGSTGIAGDWSIALNGDTLESVYTLNNTTGSVVQFSSPGYKLVTPFERDGYDVTDSAKVLFSHFITEKDQYIDMRIFKRLDEADTQDLRGAWIHAFGTNGYDLRFTPQSGILSPHNTSDSQTLRFVKFSSADARKLAPSAQMTVSIDIQVYVPGVYTIPDSYPVFRCSDAATAEALNLMFYERCFGWPGNWAPPSIWKDLTLLEKAFLNSDVREQERISMLNTQLDWDGTVFTWGSQKYYATGTNHTLYATTSFVNGAGRYFFTTGDTDFLDLILPRLRTAMDKLLTFYSAGDKIFILDDGIHLGASYQNGSSCLWDGLPFGYKDAYNNIYCYTALLRMADLEDIVGESTRATQLRGYAADVRTGFNTVFWDGDKFIMCIDINGTVRDYEMSAINLEAIANGLVDVGRASDIIDYFSSLVTPSGNADVFTKWAIGPRVLGIDNPVKASGGWWVYQYDPSLGYDNVIMGGGTTLWLGYYELMARLVAKDADDAFGRLDEILDRFMEPDHMSGGNPLYRGEINQHGSEGNVGVWGEFPESGVFPTVALYGFMGIRVDKDGLHVTPNLPAALSSLAIDRFDFWRMNLSIDVTPTSVRIRAVSNASAFSWAVDGSAVSGTFDRTVSISPGQTVTLQRTPNSAFSLASITPNVYKLKAGLSADIVMKSHTWDYVSSTPLQNGLNVVNLPAPGLVGYMPTSPDGTGGLIAEVTLPDGSKLYTDSSWKASASGHTGNPDDPNYDDTGWANATSYGGYGVSPWNTLIPGMSGTPARWIWTAANRDEYAPATIAAAAASSEAYPADYAKDGYAASCWSSLGHAAASNTEWLRMDLGMERDVRGVALTPRQDVPGACFPVDFAIQTSSDGTTFTTVSGHNYAAYPNPGAAVQQFRFTDPVRARYVRLLATKLSATGGFYYCQIGEMEVKELQYAPTFIGARKLGVAAVSASSTYPGYAAASLIDGHLGSGWSSAGHAGANNTEHVTLDLGYAQSVGALVLNAIYNGRFFPEDFTIKHSTDGSSWTTVPGQGHTAYPAPLSSNDLKFVFAAEVQARYIRIEATKLRGDGAGNYYFQLNEATPYMGSFGASASSSEAWGQPVNVTDKDSWDSFFTLWSSNNSGTESSVQWIAVDMKSVRRVDYMIVQPQYYGDFFPKDFKFQASDDGSTWTDIPGAAYTDYPKPGINFSNVQQFEFINPVHARYIRMYATKLTLYSGGGYYFQVASMSPMQRNAAYLRKTFYTGVSNIALSSATAFSSAGTGYEASKAIDGADGSSWSSAGYATAAQNEWLYVDAGSARTVKQIALKPGAGGCFPVAFKFQYSSNASTWTDIPGLSYVNYGDPGTLKQTFAIRTPVSARYIRLYATELRSAANGNYYAQIAEMQLQG